MSIVYLIQAGNDGPVLIGHAPTHSQMRRRISRLQEGNPQPLHLRHTLDGDQQLERHLHVRFEAQHVRGDWYQPTVLEQLPDNLTTTSPDDDQAARQAAADTLAKLAERP